MRKKLLSVNLAHHGNDINRTGQQEVTRYTCVVVFVEGEKWDTTAPRIVLKGGKHGKIG